VLLDEHKSPINNVLKAKYYKETDYENNNEVLKETVYFITGEKESENSYFKSPEKLVKNGKSFSWYKSGQLQSEHTYDNGKFLGKSQTWYENGQLKSEEYFVHDMLAGRRMEWYETGQIKSEIDWADGKYNGALITYWKNGKIKRRDFYKNDKFDKGTCYDSLGNEIEHFDYQKMPGYKGGDRQMLSDIANNTNYPTRSRDAGIQGKVAVRFAVDEAGNVSDIEIIQGVNQELNNEAIRVLETLAKFEPGSCDGERVKVYYLVPITFTLKGK
jgi:protein TonB